MAIFSIPGLDLDCDTDTGVITRGGQEVDEWPGLVRWIRDAGTLSSADIGRQLGFLGGADRTVRRLMSGDITPNPRTRRLLLALAREITLAG